MSYEQEELFKKICPMKSVLGREFLALQSERNKQRESFGSSADKMGHDTGPYRRSDMALNRFLDEMIPRILDVEEKLKEAKPKIEIAEHRAQDNKHGIVIDRRSEQIIWTRFAIEQYRLLIPKKSRKKLKAYHPGLWNDLGQAWTAFRNEIKRWQFGGQPFDGSQAMHTMLKFQVKTRLLVAAND